MKCESCGANLSFSIARGLPLSFINCKLTIQCRNCWYFMPIIYNRRRQIWESEKERDERRAGWKKSKYKIDPKLTEVAVSYREEGGE